MNLLLEPLVFLYNSSVAVLIVVSVGQPCGEPPYTAISYLHICFQETKFILFSILRRDWIYNCHSSACCRVSAHYIYTVVHVCSVWSQWWGTAADTLHGAVRLPTRQDHSSLDQCPAIYWLMKQPAPLSEL